MVKRRQFIRPASLEDKWNLILNGNSGELCKIIPRSYITQELGSWGIYTPTAISHWLRAAEKQEIGYLPSTAGLLQWRLWEKKSSDNKQQILATGSQKELSKLIRPKG